MTIPNLNPEEIKELINNVTMRRRLARENIRYFFAFYFSNHINEGYPMAPFHEDFFTIAEDDALPLAVILGFRGCAKSTIFSICFPIWAVTGSQQKKFILIITKTQDQAKKIMANIKSVLQMPLLSADIGPFEEESEEWSAMSIALKQYNARIMVASTEQGLRGLLYKQYRPDIIIMDDILDLASVKTQESRDRLFEWYTGDIIPMGTPHTRHIILGTRLDKDDLLSRLIDQIQKKERPGICRIIPIIMKTGEITWHGKYLTMDAVLEEKRKVGNPIAWEREYLLNLISPEDQLFKPEWITFYNKLPPFENLSYIIVGIDLAIKLTEKSDYTAMVPIYVFGEGTEAQFYIGKPIINRRLTLQGTVETGYHLYLILPKRCQITFVVEDTGYQSAAIEQLESYSIPVEGIPTRRQDKYTRASIITPLFETHRIHIPESDSEDFISQLVRFPNGDHDDMVDAMVYALLKAQEEISQQEIQLVIIDLPMPIGRGLSC